MDYNKSTPAQPTRDSVAGRSHSSVAKARLRMGRLSADWYTELCNGLDYLCLWSVSAVFLWGGGFGSTT